MKSLFIKLLCLFIFIANGQRRLHAIIIRNNSGEDLAIHIKFFPKQSDEEKENMEIEGWRILNDSGNMTCFPVVDENFPGEIACAYYTPEGMYIGFDVIEVEKNASRIVIWPTGYLSLEKRQQY